MPMDKMNIKYIFLIFGICCLASCGTVKKVVVKKEIPVITENKLFKNIYANEPDYKTIYAKRIDVSFGQGGSSLNLKAVMKVCRDSFIQVSVTAPLGIEVGRVLLTPDSIKFVNAISKTYFASDYNYFQRKFDMYIGFDCFQKILTNIFLNIEMCGQKVVKDKNYKFDITDEDYLLSTLEEKAIGRKIKKLMRKKQKNKEYVLMLQKIHIDPTSFRPKRLSIEDLEDNTGVGVSYKNFKDYNGNYFPEKIVFDLLFEGKKMLLELEFTRLEFNVEIEPNFKVSSRYKRVY